MRRFMTLYAVNALLLLCLASVALEQVLRGESSG